MDGKVSAAKKAAGTARDGTHTLSDHYHEALKNHAPAIMELLKDATIVTPDHEEEGAPKGQAVKSATDFSYAASAYAGNHFRMVGDAAGESLSIMQIFDQQLTIS
jgi:hypothetical protein